MNKRRILSEILNGNLAALAETRREMALEYAKTHLRDVELDFVVYFPKSEIAARFLNLLHMGNGEFALKIIREHTQEIESKVFELKARPDFWQIEIEHLNEMQERRKSLMGG